MLWGKAFYGAVGIFWGGRGREKRFSGRKDGLSGKEALKWKRNDYTIGIRYYKGKKGLIK